MRRRLILLTVAVTGIVVLAFLVPLFILVGGLAHDSAVSSAEREAESLARVLSVLMVNVSADAAAGFIGVDRIVAVNGSVILPDGEVVGLPVPDDEDLSLAEAGSSFIAPVTGGIAVFIPVLAGEHSTVVVRVFSPSDELNAGVQQSRAILIALGIVLIGISAWISDRLGRSMVEPVKELSETANKLGHGDLTVRVVPSGPPEIEEVGIEFNRLAARIGRLLQDERETAADLAHRLRTPLTAARLNLDGLEECAQKEKLVADLDELQRTTDFIIREARRPVRREEEEWCDLASITAQRAAFWHPLAVDQGRQVHVKITSNAVPIPLPAGDVEAAVDALIENALSHSSDGAGLAITVEVANAKAVLTVEDGGEGFVDQTVLERGVSTGPSTGLGLDIVRRTVEDAGGTVSIGESVSLGGAGIVVTLPLSSETQTRSNTRPPTTTPRTQS